MAITKNFSKKKLIMIIWLLLTFCGPIWLVVTGKIDFKADYQTANRDSAHIAPEAKTTPEAVIQVYAARAFNWRGVFASHCWIAVKPKNADSYTVYQVVGWLTYRGLPALSIMQDLPDRNWYNQRPKLLLDMREDKAEELIPRIDEVAKNYQYANGYTLWPGPNSNTFPAYVARALPELKLVLPSDAIGKDFLPTGTFFAKAPSGTGYQFSIFGVLGILIAKQEGLEINLLGFVYGIRFAPFKILLPGIG
jgi:hypothetical protein